MGASALLLAYGFMLFRRHRKPSWTIAPFWVPKEGSKKGEFEMDNKGKKDKKGGESSGGLIHSKSLPVYTEASEEQDLHGGEL